MSKHYLVKDRKIDEAVTALWQVIDEAKGFLEDPKSTPADKKTWAKLLGDIISILNKVMMAQKGEQIEEDDLIKLLEKVPEKYAKMVMDFFKKAKSELKQAAKTMPPTPLTQIEGLKFGDHISVWWIDASYSQNIDIHKLPLPNHVVETRKEGVPGIFVTVQEGETWHDPHLVYWTDNVDDISYTIESVPLVLVKKIAKISKEP